MHIIHSCLWLTGEVCQSNTLEHGKFSQECHGREGAQCDYTCNKGYRKRVEVLSCWDGKWNIEPSTACIRLY